MKDKLLNYIKLFIIFACLLSEVVLCTESINAIESGKCGENVVWSLDDSVLTISGAGDMEDYFSENLAPWYQYKSDIVEVIIEEGIKSIGDAAFFNCENLRKVHISDTVTDIGAYAFLQDISLSTIRMSKNIKSIGYQAFKTCSSLSGIYLPDGLLKIEDEAFASCESLVSITIPSSVTILEEGVFGYCTSLINATINASIDTLPAWTFYGCSSLLNISLSSTINDADEMAFYRCESLQKVTSSSSEKGRNNILNDIKTYVQWFETVEYYPNNQNNNNNDVHISVEDSDDIEIIENEDIILNEIIKEEHNEIKNTINAVIGNESGWETIIDKVTSQTDDISSTTVNVQFSSDEIITGDILQELAGTNTVLNVNSNGQNYEINCKYLEKGKQYEDIKLSFTLKLIEDPSSEITSVIGDAEVYELTFSQTVNIPIVIKLPFGVGYVRDYASIYEKEILKWDLRQIVQMDNYGTAHFYLNGIDKNSKYIVALNVKGTNTSQAIIPENLYDDYGGLMDEYGNKYEVTGYTSRWGISLKEFSIIVAIAFGATILIIGSTMFIIQRRKAAVERIRQEVMRDDYLKNYVQKSGNKKSKTKKVKSRRHD